ncbi:ESX secretion-associated protein EspG [Nocardia sp. NPDC049190]|uniref:ESX secretion-associated protein EspG n=1 Tax=Nocardia sp. NPDC049190 TaxID=3155650 RepID=UPI00340F600D
MSENRWRMDGFAFTIAMSAMGRDRLPYPLSYQPEFAEHRDDYERLRARTAHRLQTMFDERFHRALTTLLEPRIRIEVHGFYGPELSQVVRIHAGLTDRVATVAQQLPGPDRAHGRDVIITQCSADMLVAEVAAKLPRCQGGSHYPFSARRSDLNQPVYARHPTKLSPIEEMQRFVQRPRSSTGEITVYPGAAFDARPTDDGRAFIWMDYAGDGRYLLFNHNREDSSFSPGPTDEVMRQLQTRIDAVNHTYAR